MNDLSKRIADLSPEKRVILLSRLREQQKATSAPGVIPRQSRTATSFPLSFAQESLWLVDQLTPGSSAYNMPAALRLSGPLNIAALQRGLQEIVRRHESLRTTFPAIEGSPVQIIAPSLQIPLSVVDLHHLPESEREQRAQHYIGEEIECPFELTQGPLLRTTLFRLTEQEHILLLLMHHIISDGWSVNIFIQELTTLYTTFATGQSTSPLAELPIQYADYAVWHREWLQEHMENLLTYWKQQLAGAPAVLDLPTDHPRPAIQTFRGAIHDFRLSAPLTAQLQALSQQEGATLFMTLLAAFNMLLSRYTGQEDIVVGSPIANRNRSEIQGLIGYLVNMLVLRTDLSGNPSFRELLRRVRNKALEAYDHQELPFEKLVEALHPERSLSHSPLFQVLIANNNNALSTVEAAGLTISSLEVAYKRAKFDLSLFIWEDSGSLAGTVEYNVDLFERATIERLIGHWQTLLASIAADPELPLSQLALLSEAEQHQLLIEWNATQAEYPQERCVHELFEAQAARRPEATALIYEGTHLTYRELNQRANQLAHYLKKLGVGQEVCVGLCMERSLNMVVCLLGILKAGGAYVPLDPTYPKDRLAFMLQDTRAPVLLTEQHLLNLLPTQGLKVICLDRDWQVVSQEPSENLKSETTARNLAYVMYTSGSTGKPKGVEIRHYSIIRLLFGVKYVDLDETKTILHMAPISFDASTFEVWGALLHGARCILYPERIPTSKNIGAAIDAHDVTTVWLTASLFNTVIDEEPQALKNVRQVLTGGEALSVHHIRRALEVLPSTQIINGYGPTESTTFTCCHPIAGPLDENTRSIPIGRPITNTQVYILDAHLAPTPIGIPGELYIGGDGLARGYLNRPELTEEKFIPNPFSSKPDARLYKTGDLVRYLPDGTIEFLGRRDHQVKIRGFRIEPGEIEAALQQHPAMRAAIVVVREDTPGNKRLVAYMVPHQHQDIKANELRRFLRESLPEYMIPSAFVILESFPQTPSGKIDRQALPVPERGSTAEENYAAPTTMIHYQLVHLWEELLDARPIGIKDNFFFLGGHSLLAARLVSRTEQIFGKKIPLATFFAGPTIDQLAKILEQDAAIAEAPVVAIQSNGTKRPLFYMHEDRIGGAYYCFLLADQLGPDQPFYTIEPYKFDDQHDLPTLEAMAAAHIKSLQAIQPEGPYLLAGFCIGGLLAYEMARQLQAQGQQVDLLVLIDPASPAHFSDRLVRSTISGLSRLLRLPQKKQIYWFLWVRHLYRYLRFSDYRQGINNAERKRGRRNAALRSLRPIFPPDQTLNQDIGAIPTWMRSAYTSGPYAGKITFFWAREEVADAIQWHQLAGAAKATETHIIPGNHLSCLTRHLSSLADELNVCLRQVQEAE